MSRPTPAQERLAAVLTGLRKGAGLSTYQLAERLGWSQSKVTRIENGYSQATPEDAGEWAEATGAPESAREELSRLAISAGMEARSWHASHRGGLAARQKEMGGLEHSATGLCHFQPSAIPGLLQCESYARKVLTMGDIGNKGGIDAAVKARMKRQAILREPGRTFEYILTEGALRWRPGPRSIMQEQLGTLLAAAALPAVTISVIPFDREARTWYGQGFTIYHADPPVVLVEAYHQEQFIADPRDVGIYEHVFELLRESALTGDAAADFARSVILS